MKSRRSFLRILGFGAVAMPVAVKAAAESLPDMKGRVNVGRDDFGPSGAGRISSGSHTHTITPSDGSHTHTISYYPCEGDMHFFCAENGRDVRSRVYQNGAWVDTVPQFPMRLA